LKVIYLSDATSPQIFIRKILKKWRYAYDVRNRSCIAHVGEVLQSGEVEFPVEAGAHLKYLKRRRF